jgi:hypothetical protein
MATLKIFMPLHEGTLDYPYVGESGLYMVGIYLMEFFNEVIAGSSVFDSCDYFFDSSALSAIGERDLVCHILASQYYSIAKNHTSKSLGPAGTTVFSTKSKKVITEVYMTAIDGDAAKTRLLANLIIHELMHNKIDAQVNQNIVHNIVGGSVSKTPISSSSTPTAKDIAAMKKRIAVNVPQHTSFT